MHPLDRVFGLAAKLGRQPEPGDLWIEKGALDGPWGVDRLSSVALICAVKDGYVLSKRDYPDLLHFLGKGIATPLWVFKGRFEYWKKEWEVE